MNEMDSSTGVSRVILLDPSLKSLGGHFLDYDSAIAGECQKRGMLKTVALASKFCSVETAALTIKPVYSNPLECSDKSPAVVEREFFRESSVGLELVNVSSTDLVFLHTCTAPQIAAVGRLAPLVGKTGSKFVVMLRYSPGVNPYAPDRRAVTAYKRALEKAQNCPNVSFVVDSDLLADEYCRILGLRPLVLPIPHVQNVEKLHGGTRFGGNVNFVYLGNARSSKGFHMLPLVASSLRRINAHLERAQSVSLLSQANVMFEHDSPTIQAKEMLETVSDSVDLVSRDMSRSDYERLLASGDVVVLPYTIPFYHSQTSGVFAEAVGAGKPVIVPSGTWMARQVKAGAAAGVIFSAGDPLSLEDAVMCAAENLSELTREAMRLSNNWLEFNNPKVFLDALLNEPKESYVHA